MSILEDDIDNLYQTSLAITRNVHIELFTTILSPKMSNLPILTVLSALHSTKRLHHPQLHGGIRLLLLLGSDVYIAAQQRRAGNSPYSSKV